MKAKRARRVKKSPARAMLALPEGATLDPATVKSMHTMNPLSAAMGVRHARRGDAVLLVNRLRSKRTDLQECERTFLADLLEGREQIPISRGQKPALSRAQVSMIRYLFRALTGEQDLISASFRENSKFDGPPLSKTAARAQLTEIFHVCASTIRDVIEQRRTYAEK